MSTDSKFMNNSNILYCDGSFNSKTAPYAWASIVDDNEKDMIESKMKVTGFTIENKSMFGLKSNITRNIIMCKFDDVKSQQNNGAELIGFIVSLQIALKKKNEDGTLKYKQIRSDSDLIVKWWSKTGVSKSNTKICSNKKTLINLSIELRKKFESLGGIVVKIKGKDNPADLGAHKE